MAAEVWQLARVSGPNVPNHELPPQRNVPIRTHTSTGPSRDRHAN